MSSKELRNADLTGASLDHVDLTGAAFDDVDLTDATLRMVDLTRARIRGAALHHTSIRGAELVDVDISGDVEGLWINGVDVTAYVEAELIRRHPERALLQPTTADGFRGAWPVLEGLWAETVERARALESRAPGILHERVGDEWSFIETLRHLVFATDAWVCRVLLGDPSPWDPLDLPFDEMGDIPEVPWDREARPTLEEVLALRAERMATVARVLAALTDERLASSSEPVTEPGYPESRSYPVSRALLAILSEEWWHRQYAERDLAVLEDR